MPFRSVRPFRLLVTTALAVVLTASSAVPAAAVEALWPEAEQYALRLVNCTRTGGWVEEDGTCIDAGTGKHSVYRKPLKWRDLLAEGVARPQAQRIAKAGYLSHTLGGSILTRFKRAGITCCAMGESLGHWTKNAKAAVLAVHQMVQAEKGTGGWHWRNLKDKRFKLVGIGVWNNGEDFYVAYDFWDGRT